MKDLLRGLLSLTILSSTILPVIACSRSKTTEIDQNVEDSTEKMMEDIKDSVKDFFAGTLINEHGEIENNFNIINAKLLGLDSMDEFIHRIKVLENITEQDILDMINKFIEEYKLPELQKLLRRQYKETFAEDIEDFITINKAESSIKNDTNSLKFGEVLKILNKKANYNLGENLKSSSLEEINNSIAKLNIRVAIMINSKYLSMKVEPEFSYYVTDKDKTTTGIIQKLSQIVKHQIENNLNTYYQEFLNKKLAEGKIKKNDLLNLSQSKIIRQILLSNFTLNGSSAEELDFKLGAVLPKVSEVNKKTTNLLDTLKFEAEIYPLLVAKSSHIDLFYEDVIEKIKIMYKEKLENLLEKNDSQNFNLFKMNLKLTRISVLGFLIGDMQVNDQVISWDLKDITENMEIIFKYIEIILSGFKRSAYSYGLNSISARFPIWDPTKYKDIPQGFPSSKPKDMKQEEYDNKKKKHLDAINQIISIDFVNWMRERLIDAYGPNDDKLNALQISTKSFPKYHRFTKFEKTIFANLDINFRLGLSSFTFSFKEIWLRNELE